MRKPAIRSTSAPISSASGLGGICDRAAQTAADNSDLRPRPSSSLALPSGPDEIVQAVALVQRAERHRRALTSWKMIDGTLFAVKICDRGANTLASSALTFAG